jgi:nucleotide sugar dehydrogenase
MDLVVIGLGYVGLPLAQAATAAGLRVTGLDLNQNVVNGLNAGISHVDDLSDSDIQKMLAAGFTASADPAVIAQAETVIICVPTPLSDEGGPDLAAVLGATGSIKNHLQPGQLIVLESTTYPGTTDEEVRPILESAGLVAGKDFNLAFSPERIDPGNPTYGITNTPKVVGGFTPACTERAAAFYAKFVTEVVRAAGTREAEMAKLIENTYRHVNIALMNELLQYSHLLGVDLWDSIRCAASKPFGFQAFYPGPGVGGHCIPIDPNYLSHRIKTVLGEPFQFVELAQEINLGMPRYVKDRAQQLLNQHRKPLNGSRVLLIGVTYKANIADERESPVRPLARLLLDESALVEYFDPFVPNWNIDSEHGSHENDRILSCASDLLDACRSADLVIVLQPHRSIDFAEVVKHSQLLLDTRGSLHGDSVERL